MFSSGFQSIIGNGLEYSLGKNLKFNLQSLFTMSFMTLESSFK
jgi:hypothetical protein